NRSEYSMGSIPAAASMAILNIPASVEKISSNGDRSASAAASPANSLAAAAHPASARLPAAGILGVGAYLPERVLTNHDIEALVETSDEWIRTRTGISERRIAAEDETTTDLAEKAARRALEDAGIAP